MAKEKRPGIDLEGRRADALAVLRNLETIDERHIEPWDGMGGTQKNAPDAELRRAHDSLASAVRYATAMAEEMAAATRRTERQRRKARERRNRR